MNMKLPELKIGNLVAKVPIVQGGMGVGISLSNLAGNVSLRGGIGVISGVAIGFLEPDYLKNKKEANIKALRYHIKKAKEICKDGIVGVNLMTVLSDFEDMVKETVKAKADIIFSGAGLPLSLPKFTKGTDTKIAPIVSSAKAALVICKSWSKRYDVVPDAIVVEGPLAGGHLGFSKEDAISEHLSLSEIVKDVVEKIKPYEEKYQKSIPVIAGGGIYSGKQILELIKAGASGVQIGSLFAATEECDASLKFKEAYVHCNKDDIKLIQSPVGLPGRAINNNFLNEVELNKRRPQKCIMNCLTPCNPKEVKYCIADALINAQSGHLSNGFVFAGANAYKIDRVDTVENVFNRLILEAENSFK